jgi:orotate phosphoribosyltransferase
MDDLARRIRMASKLSGNFTLRSGRASDTYFDKYRFEADPALLFAIANAMAPLVPSGSDALAGLEMGGIPIVTILSHVTGLPAAFIRKKPKSYGTCQYAEGASLKGRSFVLIEDVVSSGGALIDTLAMLKVDGLWPTCALCVIDRESGGREALAGAGLELRSLFTYSKIIDESATHSAE